MKHFLLLLSLFIFTNIATAQWAPNGSESFEDSYFNDPLQQPKTIKITVYPNPATDFIQIDNEEQVHQIIIFNLVGRKLKTFSKEEGKRYDISNLPQGMYLIQLTNESQKVITTQRINKR